MPNAQTHPTGYDTPAAMWSGVRDRSRAAAQAAGVPNKLARQFVYSRFLARVFTGSDGRWVLKGGTAILARVKSARHSMDIDFFLAEGTLDAAVEELRNAAAFEMDDHLTFVVVGTPTPRVERPGQRGSELVTIRVECYAGAQRVDTFTVDIVANSVITQPTEEYTPAVAITMIGIETPTYRLYPLVDHIADKLCATLETHNGVESSRVRDLVDLVVLVRTQTVLAVDLLGAIRAEQLHRELAQITQWACPDTWSLKYPNMAREVPDCREHTTFASAVELMRQFFNPVLSGKLDDRHRWDPDAGAWQGSTPAS